MCWPELLVFFVMNPVFCFFFQWQLLFFIFVGSQRTDPLSSTDKLCVSYSTKSYLDGTYEYFAWDSTANGTIYHNKDKNKYLYPQIYSSQNSKAYLIASDMSGTGIDAYCVLETDKNGLLNADNCFDKWLIDTSLVIVNCNDICVQDWYKIHIIKSLSVYLPFCILIKAI